MRNVQLQVFQSKWTSYKVQFAGWLEVLFGSKTHDLFIFLDFIESMGIPKLTNLVKYFFLFSQK